MHDVQCSDNGSSDQHPKQVKQVKHQADFQRNNLQTSWCGVLTDCGTVWRHGCRHRAYMDVLAACPASGEGIAPSTNQVLVHG
ncbi:hypothetical protein NY670_16740, partial [Xanthomonas hortorum pv. pelargonii]|nr:hypothetical protein [Xanthomonas hortorum pv. pelargonii]